MVVLTTSISLNGTQRAKIITSSEFKTRFNSIQTDCNEKPQSTSFLVSGSYGIFRLCNFYSMGRKQDHTYSFARSVPLFVSLFHLTHHLAILIQPYSSVRLEILKTDGSTNKYHFHLLPPFKNLCYEIFAPNLVQVYFKLDCELVSSKRLSLVGRFAPDII